MTAARKYANHAQLVQGVGLVDDPSLILSDRAFLNCLAAYSIKEDPHPGNKKLARWCGVKSRQAVNKIQDRVLGKNLAVIVTPGGGSDATVYRICVEDPRFPWPKEITTVRSSNPATPELQGAHARPRNSTVAGVPRNSHAQTPQLEPSDPATPELHPNTRTNTNTRSTKKEGAAKTAAPGFENIALPEWLPIAQWSEFLKLRKQKRAPVTLYAQELTLEQLSRLKNAGNDPGAVLAQSIVNGWPGLFPLNGNKNGNPPEYEKLGLSKFGLHTTGDYNAKTIRTAEMLDPESFPAGTFEKIKRELLARGTTFANDPLILAMCQKIHEDLFKK